MRSAFAWGQESLKVKSLIYQTLTYFFLEFEITLRHSGLFATFHNSREVSFLHRYQPIFPNLPFPVISQNKLSDGNTLLYNHVLASQGLHLHN